MFWRRRRQGSDFSSEVQSHIALETDRLRAEGLSEDEAYARARQAFGNMTRSEERFYESNPLLWLDHLGQDARHALRQFKSNKAFTFIAVVTLALGIGANTAIFTLLHAVMFNTLPVNRPEELYRLGKGDNCCEMSGYQNGQHFALFSYDLYKTLRDGTPEIANMAAFQAGLHTASVRRTGSPEPAQPFVTEFVSSNYFELFGLRPAAGNFFNAGNELRGSPLVAVISYRAWQNHYGRDPSVIGATFQAGGKPFVVIGVGPAGFYGETLRTDPPDFWLPLASEPILSGANNLFDRADLFWLYLMGRVPGDAHLASLESKINVEAKRWYLAQAGSHLSAKHRRDIDQQYILLTSARGGVGLMSIAYHDGLILLMSLSSLVLLIACANVANLLLARGMALRAQTSLRLALGASRGRIMRQTLTDSVLLSLLGGTAGLLVAFGATRLILLLAFRGVHYVPITATPSQAVLGFAFVLSFITGLLFGMAPAWMQNHSDPADALRGASRSTPAASAGPQKFLVIGQIALSLMLLTGAGLLTQSLRNLERQHFGFRTDGRLLVKLSPNFAGYTPEQMAISYRRVQQRLREIPGVITVGLSLGAPMSGNNRTTRIYLEETGSEPQPGAVFWDRISPDYFETIGTHLLDGRSIDERDRQNAQQVAVVNRTFAERYFKNQNALGRHFGRDGAEHANDYEIVGMVEDAKYRDTYGAADPMYFLPLLQMDKKPDGSLAGTNYISDIELHVNGKAGNLEAQVRKTIEDAEPNLSVLDVIGYGEQLSFQFNGERLVATLTELFGLLALMLAAVGLYGVVSLAVARRTAEIGVRIALGASRNGVVAMILRGALVQVAVGVAIGIPLTVAAARLIEHRLFGVSSYDPAIVSGAAILLAACAIIAALIPARRAASIDPMDALRVE